MPWWGIWHSLEESHEESRRLIPMCAGSEPAKCNGNLGANMNIDVKWHVKYTVSSLCANEMKPYDETKQIHQTINGFNTPNCRLPPSMFPTPNCLATHDILILERSWISIKLWCQTQKFKFNIIAKNKLNGTHGLKKQMSMVAKVRPQLVKWKVSPIHCPSQTKLLPIQTSRLHLIPTVIVVRLPAHHLYKNLAHANCLSTFSFDSFLASTGAPASPAAPLPLPLPFFTFALVQIHSP